MAVRRRKSAEEKAAEAARHAAIRARAVEATKWLGEQPADGVIDVEKLAEMLDAEIIYGELDGAKARVVRLGNRARIIISKRIVGVGAIRFCIAHEIGHLLLDHYVQGDALGRAFKRQLARDQGIEMLREGSRNLTISARNFKLQHDSAGPFMALEIDPSTKQAVRYDVPVSAGDMTVSRELLK
jgi:hypothetical protein